MDERLDKACRGGDIQVLEQLLIENPRLLDSNFSEALELAASCGHVNFINHVVRLKPDFAQQVENKLGFSAMHIVSIHGISECVREMLHQFGPTLARHKDVNGWTPLHYAATRGRIDVLKEIILACPQSLEDVTNEGDNALRLAVKFCQFEAVILLEHISPSSHNHSPANAMTSQMEAQAHSSQGSNHTPAMASQIEAPRRGGWRFRWPWSWCGASKAFAYHRINHHQF